MIFFKFFPLLISAVSAQSISLEQGPKGNLPVTIEADTSVICNENKGQCVAIGNAIATRGTNKVNADKLVLYFSEEDGKHDITALSAHGNVILSTPTQRAYGDDAHYDMAQDRLKLTGNHLKLETPKETLTARDSIEYWHTDKKGYAYGDAVAIFPEKKQLLKADTLVAYFRDAPGGEEKDKQELDHIDALGNVLVSSPEEIVTADNGVYHADSELAELKENVTLTKGNNQIEGAFATFNMKTSVAHLYGGLPGAQTGKRIHGLIIPKDVKKAQGLSIAKKNEK